MKTEVNIEDYLSYDEIKEIAISEVREFFAMKKEEDLVRILDNLGYQISSRIIEEAVSEEQLLVLKARIDKIFKDEKDSIKYQLLRTPDVWDRHETSVHRVFTEAVREYTPLIKQNAKIAIESLSPKDFKQWMISAMNNNWFK